MFYGDSHPSNFPNERSISISLLSFRFKVLKKIHANREEGYHVFRGFDVADQEEVLIFLQIVRKAELNPRYCLPKFCDDFCVDEHKDFVFRGISNCFYYICVLKYSDELLKFI